MRVDMDAIVAKSGFCAESFTTGIPIKKRLMKPSTDLEHQLSISTSLVCLNFKVPLRVRQQFKICAARHNVTMTDLLMRLLDDYLTSDATESSSPRSQNKK